MTRFQRRWYSKRFKALWLAAGGGDIGHSSPFAPGTPLLSAISVSEGASIGSTVGTLTVYDGNGVYTFSITNDPDAKFQIVGNELRLAAGLDYETAASHSVTIRADNGVDTPVDRVFTISVIDVDEAVGKFPFVLNPEGVFRKRGVGSSDIVFVQVPIVLAGTPTDFPLVISSEGISFPKRVRNNDIAFVSLQETAPVEAPAYFPLVLDPQRTKKSVLRGEIQFTCPAPADPETTVFGFSLVPDVTLFRSRLVIAEGISFVPLPPDQVPMFDMVLGSLVRGQRKRVRHTLDSIYVAPVEAVPEVQLPMFELALSSQPRRYRTRVRHTLDPIFVALLDSVPSFPLVVDTLVVRRVIVMSE